MNDNSTFFEAYFIHQRFHQVDATAMNGSDAFRDCRIRHERQPFRCPDPSSRGHRRQLAANRSFTFSGNLSRGGTPALRTRCSLFWPKNHGGIARFDSGISVEEQLYKELDARAELSAIACRAHNCFPKCWWQSCTDDGRRNSPGSLRKFVAEHG